MKLLVVHPGASWSTADVYVGLLYGLRANDVHVIEYALDGRIAGAQRWLHGAWRAKRKHDPTIQKPTSADVFYQAGMGALERALRHEVDAVLVVSGMYLHPDVVILMRRAGLLVTALMTESPYDIEQELRYAQLCHAVWTTERSSVETFRAVCPNVAYLPHAWHPERHSATPLDTDAELPAHDVVFVGTAFKERIEWFQAIDWRGIDLGLYGTWEALGSRNPLRQYVRAKQIDNRKTAALYRRSKIALNLYRQSKGWGLKAPRLAVGQAQSLNPRAYELAACGAFHLSDPRAEVRERFGDRVPTFETPTEAAALIRAWLVDDERRRQVAASLPAVVAESSWTQRAAQVKTDLNTLIAHLRGKAA